MKFPKFIGNKNTRQFVSYIFVGGSATIVEWTLFYIFVCVFTMNQNIALIIAYAISTMANMLLGRATTFKNADIVNKSDSKVKNAIKETLLIYFVSAVGCGFNILFLNMFTDILHMNSMLAKILTTAIMLFGNYLVRKLGIYREKPKETASPQMCQANLK